MTVIPVSLVTEGLLDEQVLRHLLSQSGHQFAPGVCYGRHGHDHLRQNIHRFNLAAAHRPFIILADLERDECAPDLIQRWLPSGLHSNLVLRIAVRKVEAWLLADQRAFADFLGVPLVKIPSQPDSEADPKSKIVALARRSRFRAILEDVVPSPGSTSSIGKNYIGQLSRFVLKYWQIERARFNSQSLDRALRALETFSPTFSE